MRRDMKKVLVTEGRGGWVRRNMDARRLRHERIRLYEADIEDEIDELLGPIEVDPQYTARARGTIRPRDKRKWFGEHLGPLKRFVGRRVGKHWDAVYSEICEVCPVGGPVLNHLFQHLWDYVRRAEEIEIGADGKPYATPNQRWYARRLEPYGWRQPYYVCPKSGMLRRTPRPRHRKVTRRDWKKREGRWFAKRDGVWFEVTAERPAEPYRIPAADQLAKWGFEVELTRDDQYEFRGLRLAIRTVSRADKKSLKLR